MYYLLNTAGDISLDLSIITSIFAVVVSIISLVSSIVFSRLQIKHNINSVRPISAIGISDYENKISVSIKNVGTGPLIIEQLLCKKPNETDKSTLFELMPNVEQYWDDYVEKIDNWTIPVGGKITLIEISPYNDRIRSNLRRTLSDITILLKYKDIYNNEFYDERLLDFFGRNLNEQEKHRYM